MERHGDLSSEDKEAFALIFGPQFALAYSQFQEGVGAQPTTATVELSTVSAALAEGHRGLHNHTQPPPPPGPPGPPGPYWPPRR